MYIDTGTFWAIIIALGVAIGVVYFLLNRKINNSMATVKAVLDKLAEVIEGEFTDVRNESHRGDAAIYGELSDIAHDLESSPKKDNKNKKMPQ